MKILFSLFLLYFGNVGLCSHYEIYSSKGYSSIGAAGVLTSHELCESAKSDAKSKADEKCLKKGYSKDHYLGEFLSEECKSVLDRRTIQYEFICDYPY